MPRLPEELRWYREGEACGEDVGRVMTRRMFKSSRSRQNEMPNIRRLSTQGSRQPHSVRCVGIASQPAAVPFLDVSRLARAVSA